MKEKMAEWIKSNWINLSEKSAKSVINRVVAVIEKNPTTLKSALVGLAQSLNALGSKEDTSEQDQAELWFISEFISNILLPIVEPIDAQVKANTTKKRAEIWADSKEEAQAIAQASKPEKPAKPTRAPRYGANSQASQDENERMIQALATLKALLA